MPGPGETGLDTVAVAARSDGADADAVRPDGLRTQRIGLRRAGGRLFQLQIIQGADLRNRSERNFVRTVRLLAPRGEIVDRDGRVIATSRPAFGVGVIPSEVRTAGITYEVLGRLLESEPAELAQQVGSPSGRERFQAVVLDSDLTY